MIHVYDSIITQYRQHILYWQGLLCMHVSPVIELQIWFFYLTLPMSTSRFFALLLFSFCPVVWIGMDTRLLHSGMFLFFFCSILIPLFLSLFFICYIPIDAHSPSIVEVIFLV